MRDDPYWTSRKNSSELIELSSKNKVLFRVLTRDRVYIQQLQDHSSLPSKQIRHKKDEVRESS